ncbi:ABC transporter ATP-binding protein [Ilumatobacter sp.]|uniref:ABC transporter ATP-binding protein n=1 Tax=Ilumatobacter sp. TaxID=1967498 RepID=UPI003AF7DD7D
MLEVRDVSVSFRAVSGDALPVLDGVSLDVADGEIVGLLGPSGSGKSTLLRVIAGLVRPDTGRIVIDGDDVTDRPTHRRSVGMVFQDEQLFPHLDVGRNVEFGLRMSGAHAAARRQRADELLGLVGLDGFARRSVGRLSGGEAKRVALVRSLAPEPKVLLLDEPLSGLDRDLHALIGGEIAAALRSTHTTAVWVTHDITEADAIADRVLLLGDL